MSTTDLLTRVSLFQALEPHELERLAASAQPESFRAGEVMVEIGDPGHSLFLILEGRVQVVYPGRDSDFELARLGPGDFVGEMALLNDKPRSATVRARSDVRALKVGREAFRQMVQESPHVALRILETLSLRMRSADEQIAGLSEQAQRDPVTRLLNRRALVERLAEECDRLRRYGVPFSLVLVDVAPLRDLDEMFGPDVAETTVAWLGRLLQEHTRGADVPFRIGAAEFGLLFPVTTTAAAEQAAHRVVDLIAHARPPVSFDLHVTVAAGLAGCPEHGRTADELLRAAEGALARARRGGGSSVRRAPDVLG